MGEYFYLHLAVFCLMQEMNILRSCGFLLTLKEVETELDLSLKINRKTCNT